MNDDIKIPEIVNLEDQLTKSQLARLELQDSVFTDLMHYLQSHIQMLASKNALKQEVEDHIMQRVRDPQTPISMNYLLRLYEIVSQEETAKSVGVLGVLQKSTNITVNNNTPPAEPVKKINESTETLNKEEMQQALELLKLLKNLEKTELHEKEEKNSEES